MKTALYMRVSTSEQSVEAQRLELHGFCKLKGWTIVEEFEDVISGSKSDRDGLTDLMVGVRARIYDVVCAVKIDRMARSLAHFAQLAGEFKKYDVALVLTSQGIDTSKSNPCGTFQMNVLAAVAEFERDLIRERTRAGLAVARQNGKVLGHPSKKLPPWGEQVAIVKAWRALGQSNYDELGVRLGGVNRGTAWKIAKSIPIDAPAPKVMPPDVIEVD